MKVTQSCPTLCDLMDYSPPGSSVHGILQARILEWVAISFSRGSSWPRNQTRVSCIAGRFFTDWAMREAQKAICCCCCCCQVASVVSNSVRPHRRQPTRLPRPWDSPGKYTGVVIYRTAKKRKKGLSRVNKMATTLAILLWITKCCHVDKIYIIKALIFTKVPSEFCFNFYCIFYLTPVFPPLYKKLLRVPVLMTSFDIFIFSLYL